MGLANPNSILRRAGLPKLLRGVTTLGTLMVATGCLSPAQVMPLASYRGQSLEGTNLRRALVLPLVRPDQSPAEEKMVEETFVSELKKTSWFEVLHLPQDPELVRISRRIGREGNISHQDLIHLRQRFKVDAVCVAFLTNYDPFPPQSLELKAHLFSAETGDVLWAADGVFDLRDESARKEVEAYYNRIANSHDSLFDWELCAVSPSRFARFCCYLLFSTLEKGGEARS